MLKLKDLKLVQSRSDIERIPQGKILINTINAHSFNTAQKDSLFAESLACCDYLLPDGVSIVIACKLLGHNNSPKHRCPGWDLFETDMKRLNQTGGKVMFMGSSEMVLALIRKRAAKDYPNCEVFTYSPPFKQQFSEDDNQVIIRAINEIKPDLLWIGMTAPKQEKWIYSHWKELDINGHAGSIGAVFDFYAGTVKRAPFVWQRFGLEWLHRLLSDPIKLWRRYLIGNTLFVWNVLRERCTE